MKTNKKNTLTPKILFEPEEHNRLVTFVKLLGEIEARINSNKSRTKNRESKEAKDSGYLIIEILYLIKTLILSLIKGHTYTVKI